MNERNVAYSGFQEVRNSLKISTYREIKKKHETRGHI